jgi:hypothetical protein
MKTLLIIFTTSFFLTAFSALASSEDSNIYTGNGLSAYCHSPDLNYVNYCHGFINGVVEGILAEGESGLSEEHICLPENVTRGQIKEIVLKYLKDNPEKLHRPSFILIFNATRKVFPCSK